MFTCPWWPRIIQGPFVELVEESSIGKEHRVVGGQLNSGTTKHIVADDFVKFIPRQVRRVLVVLVEIEQVAAVVCRVVGIVGYERRIATLVELAETIDVLLVEVLVDARARLDQRRVLRSTLERERDDVVTQIRIRAVLNRLHDQVTVLVDRVRVACAKRLFQTLVNKRIVVSFLLFRGNKNIQI